MDMRLPMQLVLYIILHMEMPVRWCFLQWFVILHFMLRKNIQKMAEIMGINVTGDALKDADAVANAIHVFCQELGLDTLQKIFAEKGYCDNCREFTEKMIPLVMDDFKSRE